MPSVNYGELLLGLPAKFPILLYHCSNHSLSNLDSAEETKFMEVKSLAGSHSSKWQSWT